MVNTETVEAQMVAWENVLKLAVVKVSVAHLILPIYAQVITLFR
jgi:hypothetical protein